MRWPEMFFKAKPKPQAPVAPLVPAAEAVAKIGQPERRSAAVTPPADERNAEASRPISAKVPREPLVGLPATGTLPRLERRPSSEKPPALLPLPGAPVPRAPKSVLAEPLAARPIAKPPADESTLKPLVSTPEMPFSPLTPPSRAEAAAPAPVPLSLASEKPSEESQPVILVPMRRRTSLTDVARLILPPKRSDPETSDAAPIEKVEIKPETPGSIDKRAPVVGTNLVEIAPPFPYEPPAEVAPITIIVSGKPEAPARQAAAVVPPAFEVSVPIGGLYPPPPLFPDTVPPTEQVAPATDREKPESDSSAIQTAPPLFPPTPTAEIESSAKPTTTSPVIEPLESNGINKSVSGAEIETKEVKTTDVSPSAAPKALPVLMAAREKREFHLINGERIRGTLLSETTEAFYIQHDTLGVLTIPTSQVAKRMVEVILINGDRVVGDIVAESADALFIRHASLGMLTVPHAQRSTRVIEAILKNGDRILGEVLTETESYTVIRSATLGTVAVPHEHVALLNRKIEQIHLNSLASPGALALEDQSNKV